MRGRDRALLRAGAGMKRRELLFAAPLAGALPVWPAWAIAGSEASGQMGRAGPKTLRLAFRVAETSFDPAQINDLYSRVVTGHIFEGLYGYDPLARPAVIVPKTADGQPSASDDFKVWTVRIKPGIYFADDPAFKGQRRELIAEDYVYTWKRFFDPANKSPVYGGMKEEGYLGLEALRMEALKNKTPFDYDRPVEGVRALDRYTLQFRLERPQPRFVQKLATGDLFGAVAREVVEHYGSEISAHPVGTGPFRLKQWRRSSLIVLERNPGFREVFYDAAPAADDAVGQAILKKLKGRRLPMVDRVEVSIIEEGQPRWLSFLNGEIDFIDPVPPELASVAVPNGQLAPNLVKRGIGMDRIVNPDVSFHFFNMEDPLVGGYTPDKVALRRAIGLGMNLKVETRLIRKGEAIVAESGVAPGLYGYDAALRTGSTEYDPARAQGLLDAYGYVDRDGDGWREQPDGSPLTLEVAGQSSQLERQIDEQFVKDMRVLGLRVRMRVQQWPENLKAARAGKLMIWALASSAASPDGMKWFERLYGPSSGGQNISRFKLDAFDRIYRRMMELPDGPERLALRDQAHKLATAYMPYKYRVHRMYADLYQPWVVGYRRPPFWLELWQYLDIEDRPAA